MQSQLKHFVFMYLVPLFFKFSSQKSCGFLNWKYYEKIITQEEPIEKLKDPVSKATKVLTEQILIS